MDPELKQRLEAQDAKLDAIYKSVERMRKYFLIITWVTIALIVLPMIGLVFAIPAFLHNYVDTLGNLGSF